MTGPARPASPGDHGFYRNAARREFESVADVASAALECEMVCWLVSLDRQALEEVVTRLSTAPAGVGYVSLVANRPVDLDSDSVLEIEVVLDGDSEQGTGEAGLERSGT